MAYDNNGGPPRPVRKKNAFDNIKLRLAALNPQGKRATLSFGLYSNNPRITVYTNMDGDKDEGRISAAFNTPGFYSFLKLLRDAIDFKATAEKAEYREKVILSRQNFKPGGGRPEGVVMAAEVWIGKDKEGLVWISPGAYKCTNIKFIITNDEYHTFQHSTGETYSAAEASVIAAEGYYHLLTQMLGVLQVLEWVEPPPREPNAGGGNRGGGAPGGGYNRGGGNGGGGGQSYDRRGSAPAGGEPAAGGGFEAGDDLPF